MTQETRAWALAHPYEPIEGRNHGKPVTFPSLAQRFYGYVNRGAPDECWMWTGGRANGYGAMSVGSLVVKAHRVAFLLANGYMPVDDVLHSCDVPLCCNPAHLREGTHQQNMDDMAERGRRKGPPIKEVCPQGHPKIGDNLLVYTYNGSTQRKCRICANAYARDYARKKAEQVPSA